MKTIRQAWLLLPLALAACGGPALTNQDRRSAGIEGFYNYGAAGRDLKLEVRGNPFATSPEATARRVEAAVQGATWLAPTSPRLSAGPSANPDYRLVYAFDAGGMATGDQVCGGRAPYRGALPGGQPPGRVEAIAAFCQQGQSLASVEGTVVAAGPDDPRFVDLVRQMAMTIFSRDPRDSERRCVAPFC